MATIDRNYVINWMDKLFDAWRDLNFKEIGTIFNSCHHYMEDPFYPIIKNPKSVIELWKEIKEQEDLILDYDVLSVVDNTATIRWKSSFKLNNSEILLDGIYFVKFDELGKCVSFEQWTAEKE